jgi:Protein of unknown function (DUF3106)
MRRSSPARALLLTGLLAVGAAWAADSPRPESMPSVAPPPAKAAPRPAPVRVAQAPKLEAKPTWLELTASQQQSLAPLTGSWSTLSEAHKRKWLAVAQSFPKMPPGEQARLHTRMAEWAALTPQQRVQARQNYFETQALPGDDKKAKWEAYQALPAEEKKKLAAGAAAANPAAPPTAAAVQPVPQQKLARVPKPKKPDARVPRIAGMPNQVDHNTLLPQPGTAPTQP